MQIPNHTITFICLISSLLVLGSCGNRMTMIGRYVSQDFAKLDDYPLSIIVQYENGEYTRRNVTLDSNGAFKARFRNSEKFNILVAPGNGAHIIGRDVHVSNLGGPVPFERKKGNIIDIGENYINLSIIVNSPANGDEYQTGENIEFSWTSSADVTYYRVSLLRYSDLAHRHPVITVYGIENERISLQELLAVREVSSNQDFADMADGRPGRIQGEAIVPGNYSIIIYGYDLDYELHRMNDINSNVQAEQWIFSIVN